MIQRNVKSKGTGGSLHSDQWKNCCLSWWEAGCPRFCFTIVLPDCHREGAACSSCPLWWCLHTMQNHLCVRTPGFPVILWDTEPQVGHRSLCGKVGAIAFRPLLQVIYLCLQRPFHIRSSMYFCLMKECFCAPLKLMVDGSDISIVKGSKCLLIKWSMVKHSFCKVNYQAYSCFSTVGSYPEDGRAFSKILRSLCLGLHSELIKGSGLMLQFSYQDLLDMARGRAVCATACRGCKPSFAPAPSKLAIGSRGWNTPKYGCLPPQFTEAHSVMLLFFSKDQML